jgi:hypothetical protein
VRARRPTPRERAARWVRHNPILAWGAVVAAALLLGGAAVGAALAEEQSEAVVQAAVEANEADAWGAANGVLIRLRETAGPLTAAAADPELQGACASPDDPAQAERVTRALAAAWKKRAGRLPAQALESVFVLAPDGTIVALVDRNGEPVASPVLGQRKPDRDYFRGALAHRADGGVHVSRVFYSDHDRKDKIALSVPVYPVGPAAGPWVLAATVTTGETFGLADLQRSERKRALLVRRDRDSRLPAHLSPEPDSDGYRVLVHPWFKGNEGKPCLPFPTGRPRPLLELNGRPELQLDDQPADAFHRDADYRDPAAERSAEYAGRWLAGSARVGNTELVVVTQQKYEDAMAPQRRFFHRLAWWAGGVLGTAGAALGIVRLARALRRPAPTSES